IGYLTSVKKNVHLIPQKVVIDSFTCPYSDTEHERKDMAMKASMRFILLLACFALVWCQAALGTYVQTTTELFVALGELSITNIFLNDTLTVNAKDWPRTVNITRSVLVSATSERLAAKKYVLLDFKNVAMMFQLVPGVNLTFRGLELVNHYDTVGPTFRPLRQSVGATVIFSDCVQRRRAGLPLKAAIVNMREATRPTGVSGGQVCVAIRNFTYTSTRSPSLIAVPDAVNMSDYSTTVTPDSSLAYQNLYYGGYTYTTVNSYYFVDNIVSDECLAVRPGTECVTLLLQQLDGVRAGADGGETGKSRASSTVVVVVAVVVPVAVIVLAAATAAVLFRRWRQRRWRRRRQRQGESKQPMSSRDLEDGGGKGRSPPSLATVHDSGCIFLGLEEDQQLPEWSPLAADVVEEEEEDGITGRKPIGTATWAGSSNFADTDFISSPLAGIGDQQQQHQQHQQHQGRLATSTSDAAWASASASCARGSELLRPAMSTQVFNGGGGGGDEDNRGSRPGDGAAAEGGGSGGGAATAVRVGGDGGRQAAAAADRDPTNSDRGSGGAAAPPDMQAELGRMAQELRASVKDEAIKLETVIGYGSFGTVYKGTWQGLPVAVKTLVFSISNENRRRALQEAALCASINHPNVVATYSSELQPLATLGTGPPSATSAEDGPQISGNGGECDLSRIVEWRLYIVQEFADGGPLGKLYGNKALWPSPGVVNLPAVVGLALGITTALSHLHSKRIIHGDLNPNNVLLKRDDTEPSGYVVKVGDFGLSVMLPQNRSHLSNLRMGTMFYMCPAVVIKGQVGPPSDVFSLGVILWELYHGRRAGIRTPQGPRYSSIFPAFPPACPEAYRAIALHCLQRQPQNRPSAAQVELYLQHLMSNMAAPTAAPAAAPFISGNFTPPPVQGVAGGSPGPIDP
ncbi:hypothetical protein VaNZ11_005052, partial [Volvox africanus]